MNYGKDVISSKLIYRPNAVMVKKTIPGWRQGMVFIVKKLRVWFGRQSVVWDNVHQKCLEQL